MTRPNDRRDELLDRFIQAVSPSEPVILMGNSMGAVVSLLFAARYPGRADGVVLIDMPGLRSVPRMWKTVVSPWSLMGRHCRRMPSEAKFVKEQRHHRTQYGHHTWPTLCQSCRPIK